MCFKLFQSYVNGLDTRLILKIIWDYFFLKQNVNPFWLIMLKVRKCGILESCACRILVILSTRHHFRSCIKVALTTRDVRIHATSSELRALSHSWFEQRNLTHEERDRASISERLHGMVMYKPDLKWHT